MASKQIYQKLLDLQLNNIYLFVLDKATTTTKTREHWGKIYKQYIINHCNKILYIYLKPYTPVIVIRFMSHLYFVQLKLLYTMLLTITTLRKSYCSKVMQPNSSGLQSSIIIIGLVYQYKQSLTYKPFTQEPFKVMADLYPSKKNPPIKTPFWSTQTPWSNDHISGGQQPVHLYGWLQHSAVV